MISNDDIACYIGATIVPGMLRAGIKFHTIEYVNDVIKRHMRSQTFFCGEDTLTLANIYARAIETKEKNVRLVRFKQLGETALIISGMFRDYACKRMGNMYYIDMGALAYASAAPLALVSSSVYDDVSCSFAVIANVIDEAIRDGK